MPSGHLHFGRGQIAVFLTMPTPSRDASGQGIQSLKDIASLVGPLSGTVTVSIQISSILQVRTLQTLYQRPTRRYQVKEEGAETVAS